MFYEAELEEEHEVRSTKHEVRLEVEIEVELEVEHEVDHQELEVPVQTHDWKAHWSTQLEYHVSQQLADWFSRLQNVSNV